MDTPAIANYYREYDPLKRLELLKQSIENGEEPEENQARMELWELRYRKKSEAKDQSRADGYLALWMSMEFNRGAGKRLFGKKRAVKELRQHLLELKFDEYQKKGGICSDLLYRECCHMIKTYIELSQTDKNYNSTLGGLIPIRKDSARRKLKTDIYETAVLLPDEIGMQDEMGIIMRAAKEIFEQYYPEDGPLR